VDDAALDSLATWLTDRLGERPALTIQGKPGSGFSSETLVLDATTSVGDRRLVLRRDGEAPIYPAQADGLSSGVLFQRMVMGALDGVVPLAEVIGEEPDHSVLGSPFFVMEHVAGLVPIEDPPCTKEGFYAEATPEARATMVDDGLRVLAAIHDVDWRGSDLARFDPPGTTPGSRRQREIWTSSLRAGLGDRSAPVQEDAMRWLEQHQPGDPAPDDVRLSWGDARLGNMIWDAGTHRCLCVTDFEGAALAEAELDLGWWLMADRWMHEGVGQGRLPGEPTRTEQVATYERHAGRSVGDLGWYEAFAALRFATTVVHVMNRLDAQGVMPEGHTWWRDNPATEVLTLVLDEVGR
jgi:aminoglycoside phosphotransferase (APT) family kinase protein